MLNPGFIILLAGAALCFGLSRLVPTRTLGLVAALAALLAAGAVALAPAPGAEQATVEVLSIGGARFTLAPGLAAGERAVALALLGGGGAALLGLAGAVAAAVRGFGTVFAWSLLCLAAVLFSLNAPPLSLFQPQSWSVLALAGYGALRASGTAARSGAPPLGVSFGLAASALLMVALLVGGPALAAGGSPAWPAAGAWLLAALGLAACAPLMNGRDDSTEAPALLGALIFGLSAPAAALGWLLRAVAALPALPGSWSTMLGLVGGLGVLACGAGALGEQRLRALLGWAWGSQASLVVAAVGLRGPLAVVAGPSLLLSLMLGAVVAAAAAAGVEHHTGSDDYRDGRGAVPRLVVLAWTLGILASLGLPPLWGFWGRLWLLTTAQVQQPWLVALVMAGMVLLALALLAPLAAMLTPADATRPRSNWADLAPVGLAGGALLALGLAPQLAWAHWPGQLPLAPLQAPIAPVVQGAAVAAGLALLALGILLVRARSARTLARDPDEEAVRLAPEALGALLQPLAWLARPAPLLHGLWLALQLASELLRIPVGLFEQRYYLLGVLGALITIMLLMAQ